MTESSEDPFGWVGATLDGKYRVDAVVGRGGFGIVYRAHHLGFEEKVALKCLKLPKELAGPERDRFYESFMAEGRLLHQLSRATAGIVQALDVGAAVSPSKIWTPYLVLEWLEGVPLEADFAERKRQRIGGRSLNDAIELLSSAARALALAHEQGIAHRDIKPANLFIANVGGRTTLKVLDFGIAKVITESESLTKAFEATGGGLSAFTARYGAPEQFSRRFGATGPWTDVFALALVLVEAVIGRPALEGTDAAQLFVAASDTAQRPTLRSAGVEVGDGVEAVLRAALSVDPRERYPNAGAFWDALVAAARAEPELAAAAPPSPLLEDFRPTRAESAASARRPNAVEPAPLGPAPLGTPASLSRTELSSSAQIPLRTAPSRAPQPRTGQWSSTVVGAVAGTAFVLGLIGATVWIIQTRRAQKLAEASATTSVAPSATPSVPTPSAPEKTSAEPSAPAALLPIPEPLAEAAPGRLPGIPARDVSAGTVEGSGAWLDKFKIVRQERSQGVAFATAFAQCVEIGMVVCTESQWQRACAEHPVLAQAPSWTDSVEPGGMVVRGGGSCAERSVAPGGDPDPGRIGLCCDRAIAMTTTNLQRPFLSSTAAVVLKLETALNQRNSSGFVDLLDETVTIDGVARPRAKTQALLDQSFKNSPDLVIVNDVCEVSVQANKTVKRTRRVKKPVYTTTSWTAACRQSRHHDGKVVASSTTYVFDPASKLKSISETKSVAAE
jgi:serine/threonine protein kinase